MPIGKYIKQLRTERGWSYADLSERSTIDRSHLNKLEQGKRSPSLITIELIAKAFDMRAGDLLTLAGYTTRASR